jgi:hypothetical protein
MKHKILHRLRMTMVRSCLFLLLSSTPATVVAFMPTSLRSSSLRKTFANRMASADHEFTVGILGDLHMDPRAMEDYETGRRHWLPIFKQAKAKHGNVALVSLGDLGESKSVRPKETSELFAGTTECHELAAGFLSSFDDVPYEVVGGNHGTYCNLIYYVRRLERTCIDISWSGQCVIFVFFKRISTLTRCSACT